MKILGVREEIRFNEIHRMLQDTCYKFNNPEKFKDICVLPLVVMSLLKHRYPDKSYDDKNLLKKMSSFDPEFGSINDLQFQSQYEDRRIFVFKIFFQFFFSFD